MRQERCVNRDVFGEGALLFAHSADHAKDLIAGNEGSDAGADGLHASRHVEAQDGREWLIGVTALSGADFGVERIDARGVDLYEHLARGG